MNQKVLIITNIPSPYRIDFFNELSKHIDLTVLFEKKKSDERDSRWCNKSNYNFKYFFLNGVRISTDTAFSIKVIKHILMNKNSKILILNPLTPTGIFSIAVLRIMRIKFMIETDGAYFKPNQKFSNIIRRFVYSKAEYVFSTSDVHDEYYIKLGVSNDKIIRYPFTSIRESEILESPINIKDQLKESLNINEKIIILTVGQFIHRKGFDILIKSSEYFDENIGFYFIGGNITEIYNHFISKNKRNNIHFLDFMVKEDLYKYYQAADLFILPTREDIWGLVVNEAMANGLPVITSDKCLAGTELVKNNVNGFLFKSEDYNDLTSKINKIIEDNSFNEFSVQSLKRIHEYTIEKMVETHLERLK